MTSSRSYPCQACQKSDTFVTLSHNLCLIDLFFWTVKDWLSLVPPTALAAGVGYTIYLAYCPKARKCGTGRCNNAIQLTNPKVVDTIDVEDITDKAVFCRCWKSKNVSTKLPTEKFLFFFILFFCCSGRIVMDLMQLTTRKPATIWAQ